MPDGANAISIGADGAVSVEVGGSVSQIGNITLVDFYSATANNMEYYSNDGVHFNSTGVNVEAELVRQKILEILEL